jgi:hypothetical protein
MIVRFKLRLVSSFVVLYEVRLPLTSWKWITFHHNLGVDNLNDNRNLPGSATHESMRGKVFRYHASLPDSVTPFE